MKVLTLILLSLLFSCKKDEVEKRIVTIDCYNNATIDGTLIVKPYVNQMEVGSKHLIAVNGSTNFPIYLTVNVDGVQVCNINQPNGYLGIRYTLIVK